MSGIVTFYSYKGGVGRSMALANIALLLARRNLRVLTVDWDLEAPGLERYFSYFDVKPGGPGLLRLCMEARTGRSVDYRQFTTSIDVEAPHAITLLTSGREHDEAYSRNLEAFDWEGFFASEGGAFIEDLRHRWREDFDIVLIDSRTGLSDTGGICTIQLPDIVVAMFTANYQSLYGVRDVMRLAQKARQGLAYDRMPLSILPLPARWGVQEFQETQLWLDRVTEGMQEFFEDWLPRPLLPRDVIERVKIPQKDYFGFGEKLAVVEQGTSDPQGMGFVYDKVASFLASNFKDVAALVGAEAMPQHPPPGVMKPPVAEGADYLYDVFVSHDRSMPEVVLEFVHELKNELSTVRGKPARVFADLGELRTGDDWDEQTEESLLRSKVMVAIVTPRYPRNASAMKEFSTFAQRGREAKKPLLVPVLMRGTHDEDWLSPFTSFTLHRFQLPKAPGSRLPVSQREMIRLADAVNTMIEQAPGYDSKWKVAHPQPGEPVRMQPVFKG
jgi:MinD-like ATPase involved in chromosome partitioning or flagellar assembly